MRALLLSLSLVGCSGGDPKSDPADDTDVADDTDAADDTDSVDPVDPVDTDGGAEPGDDTDVAALELLNPSFEADVLLPGGYLSSVSAMVITSWSYVVTPHGYLSLWSGWETSTGLGVPPAPARGQNYVRFELWNTDSLPASASALLTSAPFGPAVGGQTCTLNYAVSEAQGYGVVPFTSKVAWSESGFVKQELLEDVALRTGYDAAEGGAWIWGTMAVALPAEADGADLTITFEAAANNLTPGMALVMLLDNVSLDCE